VLRPFSADTTAVSRPATARARELRNMRRLKRMRGGFAFLGFRLADDFGVFFDEIYLQVGWDVVGGERAVAEQAARLLRSSSTVTTITELSGQGSVLPSKVTVCLRAS